MSASVGASTGGRLAPVVHPGGGVLGAAMKLGETGIPDMAYIRRHVPIADVARELDLRPGANGLIHCWHPERHRNGDSNASASILKTANRIKCFGCDSSLLGPVDLVADVLERTPKDAAVWIAQQFRVPSIPARKHLMEPARIVHQVGLESALGLLIRSGLWAQLSAFAQRLLPVLLEFADRFDPKDRSARLRLSYRAMQRYVGVGSPRAVAQALAELEEIGWIRREERAAAGPVGKAAAYMLTPFSDQLQELANSTAADLRTNIRVERELRAERKQRLIDSIRGVTAKQAPGDQKYATKVVARTRTREGKPPRSFTR